MRIAICASPGSDEVSRQIAENLKEKGHTVLVANGGLKDYLSAIEEADALLVSDEELTIEMGIALIFADYLGKGIMAKSEPKNKALQDILDKIDIKLIG